MHALRTSNDLTSLLEDMGDRRIVMLGEASHGTHEYYAWRTAISQRLIKEKGFNFIAVEGDWPDCYKINRHVKSYGDTPHDIEEVLKTFDRWPTWMWGNWEIAALADWLRQHNRSFTMDKMVGFYGLDVYSLWESMTVMMNYLEKEDPIAARAVKKAINCFEPFNESEQSYARFTLNNLGCSKELLAMLKEIRTKAQFLDGDREAGFNAEQNALIAVNAERYYRSMMSFDNESWNIRDRHMMETLDRLMKFHGKNAKAIVWEHNTHIGDARATDMSRAGMVNIGQLAREEYGEEDVYLVGFASYGGTVIAGNEWGAPMKIMQMPDAKAGSIEADLHRKEEGDHYLLFSEEKNHSYQTEINHRAIGVVYNPAMERSGNYVPSVLSRRYDAFMYLDKTMALHPLHLHPDRHKLPATYPFNL
ncbi:erythromycin esterase family protein [Polluticoccus soli]|uniref:erythromycin esterase family protein n=1 Tax=Polluticoccus soli TaxID=3034150 RepID=UPI0023E22B66|nr:erythromycin esterase family protein [Flavipsychrobacter sp. JY13-12]